MIDLSHLTEEEQGVIMTVLRRDAELKKAEEERIRKLETILNNDAQSDYQLKYLTGEWFYEAKSRRHMDKIHGSEIILASMKQRKASGLEGSLRLERFKAPSSRGSDVAAPPKPARCLEATQPQEMNDPEKENLNSAVRSPRTPRHNPFNRASLIVVDPPENPEVLPKARDQDSCETEPISPLKSTSEGGQTLGGSITSESSSVGFRPVPKKRTFLSRRSSSQTDSNSNSNSNGLGSDTQVNPVITPAPRRSIRRGSSGSSHHLRGQDEKPEKSVASAVPNHTPQPAPAFVSVEEHQPPLRDAPHAPTNSNSNSEKDRTPRCQTTDSFRPTTHTRSNASVDRDIPQKREDRGGPAKREHAGANTVAALAGGVRDSDQEISSSSATSSAKRQAELSFTQSIPSADPPMSYDLNFIDTFEQPSQKKSTQKHVFKLSNQTTSPTADEEDSIAKVLDWFSRSTDSSDWLNGEDGPEVTKCSDRRTEIMGSEELLRKDVGDVKNDGRKESVDTKRGQRQSSESKELRGNKEVIRTQEEVKKDVRERTRSLEMQDSEDVSQSPQISQLKSFWESSSTYPKIQKSTIYKEPIDLMLDTDEEKVSNTSLSDIHSAGLYNGKGIYDQYTSNDVDEREKKMVISTQKDTSNSEHAHMNNNNNKDLNGVHSVKQQIPASQKNYNDQPFNTDYFKLASSKAADGGDEEILCVTRLSPPPPWSESQDISLAQPKLDFPPRKPSLMSQDISFTQPKPDFPLRKPSLQEELLKPLPQPQLDVDLKSLDPQKLHTSRNNQQADHKPGGNEVQSVPKSPRHHAGSIEDLRTKDDEDKSLQKKKEEAPKDKTSTPHSERIRQLKSFWEQERSKPMFYTGKPKTLDGKPSRGPKLNKRFTKSEYDLRSIGNGSGSDDEAKNPVRLDKLSPSLGASRAQFNTLREFWGEATSDSKGSLSSDKSKSPKRKEPICLVPQTPPEPELHRTSSVKSNNERQTGSRASSEGKNNHAMAEASPQREPRRMSKDSGREEKAGKPQSHAGKEPRSPKSKKDSFSSSSSRGSSLRRATSMFSLSGPEEKDQGLFRIDVSPVHSHSRKQSRRYNMGAADDSEGLTPRARAFVPTDYRHYLGMTDKTRVHASPAPPAKDEAPDDKARYDLDLDEAPRASTPLGSEERYGKKAIKMSPRHQWTNYSSSDTGQESSVSSTSETWPASRTVSARENDDEDMNPVRKALRRAEARPKTVAKSMEDITAALSPRQERRPDPVVDKRRISDVSSIPSPSSSFSDPEHLKNMSKSVPSFLQKELSGSVMTMYGGDFGNVEVQGNIQFSINYVQRLREFHIFVAECRDLAAVDPKRGRSDPYVKSYLVPDKANLGKRKTSVKKKTLNPSFNEILRYRVRMEYLRTQTLILSVWHNDTFGRNSFLGEVDVDLATWDFDHTQMNYLPLKARTAPTVAPTNGQGEMRLAIRYLPQIIHSEGLAKEGSTTGEVHIWVKDCKNLPLIRSAIDPYVKCFVLPDTSRKSRQKTRVLRRTADPVFNHTMVYDGIREADLTEACVELTVWDRDRLASNLLGGLRLGSGTGKSYGAVVDWMDSTPYEAALWDRMVASPNEWVEDVLPLRVLNSAKTAFK